MKLFHKLFFVSFLFTIIFQNACFSNNDKQNDNYISYEEIKTQLSKALAAASLFAQGASDTVKQSVNDAYNNAYDVVSAYAQAAKNNSSDVIKSGALKALEKASSLTQLASGNVKQSLSDACDNAYGVVSGYTQAVKDNSAEIAKNAFWAAWSSVLQTIEDKKNRNIFQRFYDGAKSKCFSVKDFFARKYHQVKGVYSILTWQTKFLWNYVIVPKLFSNKKMAFLTIFSLLVFLSPITTGSIKIYNAGYAVCEQMGYCGIPDVVASI